MKLNAVKLNVYRLADKSGAKATAVQTLRDSHASADRAKRLDCGAFPAAFGVPAMTIQK